ncbi:MAG: site-specific integrase [Planctomycetes bacterium]|nr:site-specific integrase [Planctomycetota bacterium]
MDEIKVKVTKHGTRKYLVMYYDDPITGTREQRSTKQSKRREADREAAKWEAELREGRYKRASMMTWAEFRERYEDEWLVKKSLKMQSATSAAFNHFEKLVGVERLANVKTEAISRYQVELRKTGIKETSIACYLRHLRTALNWAVRKGLLRELPDIDIPKQMTGVKLMRGRPITAEEFDRMLMKIEDGLRVAFKPRGKQRPRKRKASEAMLRSAREQQQARIDIAAPVWHHYLNGLWLSGLRLEESVALSWDQDEPFCIDLTGRHPRFRIYAEAQKGRRDQFLPMTPDFAEFILQTPVDERHGSVFKLGKEPNVVSRVVSAIGKTAGVIVNKADGKFASAHDLRRAFGTRWSFKVKPATLKLLMRHQQIETTMRYYVDQDADDVADQLWKLHGVGTSVGTSPNRQADGAEEKPQVLTRARLS